MMKSKGVLNSSHARFSSQIHHLTCFSILFVLLFLCIVEDIHTLYLHAALYSLKTYEKERKAANVAMMALLFRRLTLLILDPLNVLTAIAFHCAQC